MTSNKKYTRSLTIEGTFDSAHRIVGHEGKCANLHGHTYQVQLKLETDISREELAERNGMLVDFGYMKKALKECTERYDHHYLNDFEEFAHINPTAELIAEELLLSFIENFSSELVKLPKRSIVLSCSIWETPINMATFSLTLND